MTDTDKAPSKPASAYQRCGSCLTPAEDCDHFTGGDCCCPQCFHWLTAYANGSMFRDEKSGSSAEQNDRSNPEGNR